MTARALDGNDVQPLGAVLADAVQGAGAAGADIAIVNDDLYSGQVRRQRAKISPPLGSARQMQGRVARFDRGLRRRFHRQDILLPQLQLFDRQVLGPIDKAVTLELPDDLFKPFGFGGKASARPGPSPRSPIPWATWTYDHLAPRPGVRAVLQGHPARCACPG